MAKVTIKSTLERTYYTFRCPGCQEPHQINDGWGFNDDVDRPTFSPSVLLTTGCGKRGGQEYCWCNYEERAGEKAPFECGICHSFVRDGRIEFLSDCTHSLAGQTVELPDIVEETK